MSGLTGIFDVGKLSLLASQRALQVVSQNLANANTPGYSRQEVILEQTAPTGVNGFQVGTGVTIAQVRRMVNGFLENQTTVSQQDLGRLQAQADSYVRLGSIFPDSNDQGISRQLNEFFNALRNVAGNPQGQTERTVLLAQATSLTAQINRTAADLVQIRKDLNTQVSQTVAEVNTLASQVAVLNGRIAAVETSGQAANDLRDQRGQILNELAKRIEIHMFEDPSGQVQVFVGRGSILVERSGTIALAGAPSADNDGFLSVTHRGDDITALIGNGSLNGLLATRDGAIPEVQNRLNVLTASLVNAVNQVHAAGYALDGTTGNNFFSALSVTATPLSTNTGALTVTGGISTASALTLHDYSLAFAGGGAYTITDQSTNATVASGTYAGPGPTTLPAFDGLTLTFAGATPASGDTYTISAHKDAAKNLAVALSDVRKVAASATQAGLPGDNSTALALIALQSTAASTLSGATLNGYYAATAAAVGSAAQGNTQNLSAQEVVRNQLDSQRGEASGVSIDEELTNMIQFQRAYQAAAKLIVTADELFQALLDIKR